MVTALWILGAVGHVALWVALVNRLHAVAMKRLWIDALTLGCGLGLVAIPLGIALAFFNGSLQQPSLFMTIVWCYLVGCAGVSVFAAVRWIFLRWHPERFGIVLANHTVTFRPQDSLAEPLTAPGIPTWLARLPFNEALSISVHEKSLVIPRLSSQHAGIRIAHLSDLHMSGRIGKAYFEQMVEHVNRLEPDVIAVTGDIVEREPCLAWIADTLGKLRARAGVFYCLGNHDIKVGAARLHAALRQAGLIHVGGQWLQTEVRGAPVLLAGNELPWFGPAAELEACPATDPANLPLRITLVHSPDQFRWAQAGGFDLVLAGHNHGGQVRLPLVGAILAPSLHGVRYAAGTFRAGNTVLHVSRGSSCLTPLRYNCPPEIALLDLRTDPGKSV